VLKKLLFIDFVRNSCCQTKSIIFFVTSSRFPKSIVSLYLLMWSWQQTYMDKIGFSIIYIISLSTLSNIVSEVFSPYHVRQNITSNILYCTTYKTIVRSEKLLTQLLYHLWLVAVECLDEWYLSVMFRIFPSRCCYKSHDRFMSQHKHDLIAYCTHSNWLMLVLVNC